MKTFSIKEALKFGWEKTKTHFSPIFTILLILLFINISLSFLNKAMGRSPFVWDSLVYFFTMLGFMIIEIIVVINIIKQALIIIRGGKGDVKRLLDYPDIFFWYVIGEILVGIIVVIGFIILIVPGIILALMFCFYKPVIVDLNLRSIEALKKSYHLTKGHLWHLFLFFIVALLVNLLGLIVLGIGLFVTIPITFFAMIYLYDHFLKAEGKPNKA